MGRLILVSNRLPVTVRRGSDGNPEVIRSSGGLVAALGPIHEAGDGMWIGNLGDGGLEPDTQAVLEERRFIPVPVSRAEIRGYYFGYSNSSLWPLLHYLPERARFDRDQYATFRTVNQRFADKVVELAKPDDTIWVHDYQLLLVPGMIREKLPDAKVGFFLHTPFPSSEMFRLLPEREEILNGVLGSNVVGFHTYDYARHFVSSVLRVLGIHIREGRTDMGGHHTEIATFPIGIDVDEWHDRAESPEVSERIQDLKSLFRNRRMILGVERLDYTKGVPLKLQAFRQLLLNHEELRGEVLLVQIVVPSRENIATYEAQRREIEQIIGQINGEFGTPGLVPIHYQHSSTPPVELAALYRSADVAFVAPIRDGMNLVAKEFIACQDGGAGALVLSEFAGAASELGEAFRVNPWDVDGTAETLYEALEASHADRQERVARMLDRIKTNDVHRWARLAIAAIERPIQPRQRGMATREPDELASSIRSAFEQSKRPVVLLDYDGTLREFVDEPSEAVPTDSIMRVLRRIENDPRTTLVIVSGRDAQTLESWFKDLDITLIAEHGAWMRMSQDSQWVMAESLTDGAWKRTVLEMMTEYVRRTPGSAVEEKSAALVWHYRASDTDIGRWQARELTTQLEEYLANEPVEVIEGSRIVEVRQQGINKGTAYREIEQAIGPFDFHLAIGDDTTDEDLFAALPPSGISIHVGSGPSRAKDNISSPSSTRALLRALFPQVD